MSTNNDNQSQNKITSDQHPLLVIDADSFQKDYVELLSTDGVFKWSTYYKTDGPDHWKWTFGSSFFYAMNVYTTVGYGKRC